MKKFIVLVVFVTISHFAASQDNMTQARIIKIEALEAFNNENYSTALQKFKEIESIIGVTEKGLFYEILCLFHLNRYNEAENTILRYYAMSPAEADLYEINKIHERIKNYKRAEQAENEAYKKALYSGKLSDIKHFLTNYPNSEYAAEVERLYQKLLYNQAMKNQDLGMLKEYISQYPNGENIGRAIEEYDYQLALKENDLGVYEDFKKKHPRSKHIPEVNKTLVDGYLYWADKYFNSGEYYSAVFNYDKALNHTVTKKADIVNRIAKAYFHWGKESYETENYSNAKSKLERCIEQDQAGSYAVKAKQMIATMDEELYDKASSNHTVDAYKEYLEIFPEGKYANQAQRAIADIHKQAKRSKTMSKVLFGEANSSTAFYLDAADNFSSYHILSSYYQTYSAFGFSFSLMMYDLENNIIASEVAMGDLSLYLSPNGGMGIHGLIGYQVDLFDHSPSEQYFNANTWGASSSDIGTMYIKYTKFHYGLGYQNTIGNFYFGINYQWYVKSYKADPDDDINFDGLDISLKGSSVSVRIGYYLDM